MSYRHRIVTPPLELRNLALAASQVAAQRLRLPYRPAVNFFIEDQNGRFERPWRVSGFVDYYRNAEGLDIFCRNGQSEPKTIETIWHEAKHITDFVNRRHDSRPLSELRAERFGRLAPAGMHALSDEIELYVSCGGDPEMIAETRKRRAHNLVEQNQFVEMLQRRSRYVDDEDEEEESAEDAALPVKPVMGLDILTLMKAEAYLKDVYESEQVRAQGIKERMEREARWAADRARRDAELDADFNRWNGEK